MKAYAKGAWGAVLLAASLSQAQPPKGKTEITWWGHAAFVIRTPQGAIFLIDPWFKNPKAPSGAAWPEAADAILVTHGHSDHVGDTVELAKKAGAPVIGSFELVQLLGLSNTKGTNIGGSLRIKDATIHLVEAVHSSGYGQSPQPLQYGGSAMGVVLEIDNGPIIYHAGDTDVFSSMQLIADRYRPTVALLPIGGHFTMDPKGAALAARLLKVKTIIPMHFGTFPELAGTPEQLTEALKKGGLTVRVLALKAGETTPVSR